MLVPGVAIPLAQDFALLHVEFHEAPAGPFLSSSQRSGWKCNPSEYQTLLPIWCHPVYDGIKSISDRNG